MVKGVRALATVTAVIAIAAGDAACGASPSVSAASAPAASGAPAANGEAAFGSEAFRGPMKAPAPTQMAAELRAMGLDPAALPPLEHLPPGTLRKVMRTFARSLGARCTDCHLEADYAAPTPRKAIATRMWGRFVRGLAFPDGSPVYCDSCHQGAMTPLLDRHDEKALSRWMDDSFVLALKRRDGKEHDCATCHGEPFDPHLLHAWSLAK